MRLIEDFIPDGAKCDTRMLFGCGQPRSITLHWTGPFQCSVMLWRRGFRPFHRQG